MKNSTHSQFARELVQRRDHPLALTRELNAAVGLQIPWGRLALLAAALAVVAGIFWAALNMFGAIQKIGSDHSQEIERATK
jgi:hypothetical protein